MKRLLLALLLIITIACSLPATTQDRVQSSLIKITGTSTIRNPFFNIVHEAPYTCSGFVVSSNLVLTAEHCIGNNMLADGLKVKLLKKDEYYDLALLYVPELKKPSLKLRSFPVVRDENLLAVGYGNGWSDAIGLQERVILVNYGAAEVGRHSTGIVVQGGYAAGMSGGPVVDESGDVVSVVQEAVDYNLGYGVSYTMIHAFLEDARLEVK